MTVKYVIVKGSADYIAGWLWDFTDYSGTGRDPPHFRTEDGQIVLGYPGKLVEWSDQGRFEVRIDGYLVPPDQRKATRDKIRNIIIFRTLSLDPEWVEVAAESNHPAVTGHVEEVLRELKRRWPEAKRQLEARLGEALEEKPEWQKSMKMSLRQERIRDLSLQRKSVIAISLGLGYSESTIKRERKWLRDRGLL